MLKNLAASFLAARSFDKAVIAIQNDDNQKLRSIGEDMKVSAKQSGNPALLVATTTAFSNSAASQEQRSAGATGAEKARLWREATDTYNIALSLLPSDYQKIAELDLDYNTLNILGYHLADHGKKPAEFQLAEFLTAASLAEYNKFAKDLPADDPRLPNLLYLRDIGPGDSKAWALFKQKRYAQARNEQEQVLGTALKYGPALKQRLTADIPFHLGEIYLAQDEISLAQSSYELALSLAPDAELKAKLEARLAALKNSRPG